MRVSIILYNIILYCHNHSKYNTSMCNYNVKYERYL